MRTCKACGESKPLTDFGRKLKGYQTLCKPCHSAAHKAWREKNRDRELAKAKARYHANREEFLAKQKAYYAANREERLAYLKAWREQNPGYASEWYEQNADRERQRAKDWKHQNPEHQRVLEVARRSAMRRVAPWADRDLMADIYKYAKIMRVAGIDCHVDHIVPLRGKNVCGLHTDANLTVLLAEDNLRKGARL